MKSLFPASILTIAAAFLLFGGLLRTPPNDTVFKGRGDHLVPAQETQIDLKREVLNMTLRGGHMSVDVHFEFFNPGSTRTVTVGFVTPPVSRPGGETEKSPIKNFSVVMNGEKKEHDVQLLGDTQFDSGLGNEHSDVDYVHHFSATFEPGLNVLKHSYTYEGKRGSMGTTSYPYRLTTGTNWANGTIEEFVLNLDMGHQMFEVSASFAEQGQEPAWEVVGRGRLQKTGTGASSMLTCYTGRDGYLSFQKKNFTPTKDLFVRSQIYIATVEPLGPLPLNQHLPKQDTLAEMYRILADRSDSTAEKVKKLKQYNASQLRILRNAFFAVRGYAFKDETLQDHFEQYFWYVPEASISASSIDLTEEELTWIERLKALESETAER